MELKTFSDDVTGQETEKTIVQETTKVFDDIYKTSKSLTEAVDSMLSSLKTKEYETKNGLSFLELRNLLLLNYETDLASVVMTKCQGKSLQGSEAVDRLVETRTVMEKMKPIYFKLKYRIEKLIKAANMKVVDTNDPLQLRPNLQAMDVDDVEDVEEGKDQDVNPDEEDEEDDTATDRRDKNKIKKYVPPKVAAVSFDGDDDPAEVKKQKALERAKKRALNSALIQELRSEFDDAPEEIYEETVGRRIDKKKQQEKVRYEEEYLTRLPETKERRKRKTREEGFVTVSSLGRDITRFDDVSALDVDDEGDTAMDKKKVKRKKLGPKAMKRVALTKKKFKRKK